MLWTQLKTLWLFFDNRKVQKALMDCVTTFEQKSIAITTTNVTIAVDLKVFFKKRILWFSNKGVNRERENHLDVAGSGGRHWNSGVHVLILLKSPFFEKGTGGIYSITFSPKNWPQIGQPAQSANHTQSPVFLVGKSLNICPLLCALFKKRWLNSSSTFCPIGC